MAISRVKHGIHASFLSWIRPQHPVVAPNFFYARFEMDVMAITKEDLLLEFELKISAQDYRADFMKSFYEGNDKYTFKHDLIKSGQRANRFYFVLSDDVGDVDIPDYAGVIRPTLVGFKVVKKAPVFDSKLIGGGFYKSLSSSLSWREYELRGKLRRNGS